MSDYLVECATKEEWASRAFAAEARVAELEAECWRMQEERDRAIGWRDSDQARAEAADQRAAELEAERDESLNQLDSERHSVSVLESRNRELLDKSEAAEQRAAELEAKLAKAVETLDKVQSGKYGLSSARARFTLAEIKDD